MIIPNSEKHRRTIRLDGYDYSNVGAYFVTICTRNQEMYFEQYPKLRAIVQDQWNQLPKRFPNIELDEFVIMPNHIHGIIFIVNKNPTVGAIHELPLQDRRKQRRRMMLPKIIGYFKMNTAKQINKLLNRPGQPFWQRNYYEHIIRNKKSLERIQEYIHYNPQTWELDRENPNRIRTDEFDEWLYGEDNQ